jgi:hypothetical protein
VPIFGGGLLLAALWIFCIVDVFVSDEAQVRRLSRLVWLLIVLALPDVGSIVWLLVGRPIKGQVVEPPPAVSSPEDDAEFLRKVRQRAEEQRRAARERRKAEDES